MTFSGVYKPFHRINEIPVGKRKHSESVHPKSGKNNKRGSSIKYNAESPQTQALMLGIKKLEIWPKIRGPMLVWFRERRRVLLISSHTADMDDKEGSCFFNPAKCHLPALFFQPCLSNSHHSTGHWSDRRTLTPCSATGVWIVCELNQVSHCIKTTGAQWGVWPQNTAHLKLVY